MEGHAPGSLLAYLARIPDPRSPHGRRFPLTALLAAAWRAPNGWGRRNSWPAGAAAGGSRIGCTGSAT